MKGWVMKDNWFYDGSKVPAQARIDNWNGPICSTCGEGFLGAHDCPGHQCDATRKLEAMTGLTLHELQKDSYRISKEHGFHETDQLFKLFREHLGMMESWSEGALALFRDLFPQWNQDMASRRLMLISDEVAEAHEELRSGHDPDEIYYGEDEKPEGVPIELADVLIRVADFAEMYDIDLTEAVKIKQAYNETRPHKHGRQY